MIGQRITTTNDIVAIVMDKVRVTHNNRNTNQDHYLCKIIKTLNGDESEYGEAIIISPFDIVSFYIE